MNLKDVGLIAADTSRSRIYLQALIRHNLLPSFILLLENKSSDGQLPGQISKNASLPRIIESYAWNDDWSEIGYDLSITLQDLIQTNSIKHQFLKSSDINTSEVIEQIQLRPEPVFIYSGFGGVILRKDLLTCGKKFLHVHGGYLPDYKGSTTNYFSILAEDQMGASAMLLNEKIDGGPVLYRKKFTAPKDRLAIDHIFDSAARAKVLILTLQKYLEKNQWHFELENNQGGETYYIIHPVLKHIAIMANSSQIS